MKNSAYKLLKYTFAALFLLTAVGKLLDNRGFAEVLANYRLFPSSGLLPLAMTISLAELHLGWHLLRRANLTIFPQIVLVINCGYFAMAGLTLYRGIPLSNCGCFGVFLARPLTVNTLYEDGVLVALSFAFVLLSKHHQRTTS